jgi:dienelactone hydrolase
VPYQVFVPDLLEGNYPDPSWFPSDTEEKIAKRTAYMQGQASPAKAINRIPTLLKEMTEISGGKIEKWASVGYCWGGKVDLVSFKLLNHLWSKD